MREKDYKIIEIKCILHIKIKVSLVFYPIIKDELVCWLVEFFSKI